MTRPVGPLSFWEIRPDSFTARSARVFLMTTYSTFAVGADGLFLADRMWIGVVYAAATVLVGAAASLAGIALGSRSRRGAGA